MKPPKSFYNMSVPEGWKGAGMFLDKGTKYIDGQITYDLSICCNDGRYWEYAVYKVDTGEPHFAEFDASGCETLEEVCKLVEVLARML